MNKKPVVKIIKNGKREVIETPARAESNGISNRWSTTVQQWIGEFQKRRRDEPLPAFDGLFK
jgi:hypothetical protein